MFGLTLILVLIIMGGAIAFIGDRIGSRVGKKRLTLWGLRPRYTSILITIITGILIAGSTLSVLTVASYDVRTALFGMEKLKIQLSDLSHEVGRKSTELEASRHEVEKKNTELSAATIKVSEINQRLTEVDKELKTLQTAKQQLSGRVEELNAEKSVLQVDIDRLNELTANLRKGIEVVREGTVVFRAGEILGTAVLKTGRTTQQMAMDLNEFLAFSNRQLLDKLGITDKNLEIIFVPKSHVEELLQFLADKTESVAVRLISVGNVVVGEPVIAQFAVYPNRLVFAQGAVISTDRVLLQGDSQEAEKTISLFLRKINEIAVREGVLPDPLQGTVGVMSTEQFYAAVNQIRKSSGKIEITATAKADVYTIGPLRIDIQVRDIQ